MANKYSKKKDVPNDHELENIISLDSKRSKPAFRTRKDKVVMIPRNTAQENYIVALENYDNKIVFATGPAGTGKSLLATQMALKMLLNKEIERIVVTRPAVSAEEDLGFLPGDILEKMAPWVRPIMDIFEEYYRPVEIKRMIEDGVIEIAPVGMLRGRTFKDCVIILDESQNLTSGQMKMATTRLGDNSRMFVTGDVKQTDIKGVNGLVDVLEKLKNYKGNAIKVCTFEKIHVERSEIVGEVLSLYGED